MQVLDAFKECTLGTFVDGTLGAGGHSAAVLRAHPEMRLLLGIDKDPIAHAIAEQTLGAAAVDRDPPLDIRQIQVQTLLSYGARGQHAELRLHEYVKTSAFPINGARGVCGRYPADDCSVGYRGHLQTFLCCWRTLCSGPPRVWLMGSCWIWACHRCR